MDQLEAALTENLEQFTAFARSRISDPELASDVVQESLLKALKSADQLKENENAVAWFYKILRHSIIDLYRHREVDKRAIEKLMTEADVEPNDAEEKMVCRCFERLLPTLKPEYAELIRSVDLNENSLADVSKRVGITTNNLNVRLHRARNQLRERLEQTCGMCSKHGCLNCTCEG